MSGDRLPNYYPQSPSYAPRSEDQANPGSELRSYVLIAIAVIVLGVLAFAWFVLAQFAGSGSY